MTRGHTQLHYPDTELSSANQSFPYPINVKHQDSKWQASILYKSLTDLYKSFDSTENQTLTHTQLTF